MKEISLKCAECGAKLKVDVEHSFAKCPYCGAEKLFEMDKDA